MNILIQCRPDAGLLEIAGEAKFKNPVIRDRRGRAVPCPVLEHTAARLRLDAAALKPWSVDAPECYTFEADGLPPVRFGCSELATLGNDRVLLNGHAVYLRGYIRGIVAHDHPNMTGKSRYEAHVKNIRQAKKYGFNLVRFHSTVPDEDFVRAADELGLLIHMEIGFAYRYDAKGRRKGLAIDNRDWTETILRYRNSPSVAIFCLGNEMHNAGKNPTVAKLYAEGKRLAPHKLILDNSGWGEFDRTSADIFSQHIAYYFPYAHHREMFRQDFCWHLNGSVHETPMTAECSTPLAKVRSRRHAEPVKPVLAHEAVHYIEITDYEKLNAKFDRFARQVGDAYLSENGIEKPRYLTELPELIRRKQLQDRMADYRAASELFKKFGLKTYLEELRSSALCGFEMLQFADCLKYENKNGIVDCFDDDKFIDPEWMREFNADTVLLADFANRVCRDDDEIAVALRLSHFALPENLTGELVVTLSTGRRHETIYTCPAITTAPGLQKLVDLVIRPRRGAAKYTMTAEFKGEKLRCRNSWDFYVYASPRRQSAAAGRKFVETHKLDHQLFRDLEGGKTVLLHYHRDQPGHRYRLPGALDRFKPCIWDRGSHLGGIIRPESLRKALLCGRYFESCLQPLVEGGYKINLDHFPVPVEELVSGVDKPVRDRMKGLIHKVKDFIPDDTLRNFCYLFVLKVGKGTLIVSTFKVDDLGNPAVAAYLDWLRAEAPRLKTECSIEPAALKQYLRSVKETREDVMNHFWERDNQPVETTLFWEEAGIDIARL